MAFFPKFKKRKKNKLDYKNEFIFLSQFYDFKMGKNKSNFSPAEKSKITRKYNEFKNAGYITHDLKLDVGIKKIKNPKNKMKVEFIVGARPEQKINRKGEIIISNKIKKLFVPVTPTQSKKDMFDYLSNKLKKQEKWDFYTISVQGGWEINLNTRQKKLPKAQRIKRKWGEGDLKRAKINDVNEAIIRYTKKSEESYLIGDALITGVYFYTVEIDTSKNRRKTKKKKTS